MLAQRSTFSDCDWQPAVIQERLAAPSIQPLKLLKNTQSKDPLSTSKSWRGRRFKQQPEDEAKAKQQQQQQQQQQNSWKFNNM